MTDTTFKILIFIITACLVVGSCDHYDLSEEQSERFVRYLPTTDFSYGEGIDVIQNSDGEYMILGTALWTATDRQIMIMKTDEFGREIDQSPLLTGSPGPDDGYKIIKTDDGGCVIAGSSKPTGTTYGYLLKIDPSFSEPFPLELNIGSAPTQEFMGITITEDERFILTGYSKETTGDKQVYLVKTDEWGVILWERVIGFTDYNDVGVAVVENNGRILIVGTTTPVNSGSGNSRLLILNTNSLGKGMTELRISGNGDLSGVDMVTDTDGNIIILGNHQNSTRDVSEIYLTKIKLEGFNNELITVLYATSIEYEESLYCKSMVINEDNSLAIVGWRERQGDKDILFARIKPDLSLNDIQFFGSSGYQSGSGISGTADGGYIITGGADVAGEINTVLIKLGPDGKLY